MDKEEKIISEGSYLVPLLFVEIIIIILTWGGNYGY